MSHDDVVAPNHNPEPKEDQDEERLLRVLSRANSKPGVEVVPYDEKLDTNVVLDWISNMEKFFEYENTPDNKKVKIAVTRLKGHASLGGSTCKLIDKGEGRRRSELGQRW